MDLSNVLKLWDSWNIRAFIILSLLIQAFLILFAPLRKRLGGKWGKCVRMMIWSVYLLADWIAGLAIGSILSNQKKKPAKTSDIQAFWAPFLLLHLGGPDTITSFALEDNEFWVRHLLGMALQVGSTVYIFIMSLPDNKLWLPTVLVLIAGIIKYVERNRAFYLASFDQFGDNWVPREWAAGLPIPVQFKDLGTADCLPIKLMESSIDSAPPSSVDNDIDQYFADSDPKSILQAAVYLFGTIRRPLHSYFLSKSQLMKSFANFGSKKMDSSAKDALRKMEIELSLLYEVLHTKFPVVISKIGYISRGLNFGCILGAMLSFSLVKKQYELVEFDACLTYGLLIGALALDFISIILIVSSDWFFVAYFHNNGSNRFIDDYGFINRRRWSKAVPQLNFITYSVKDHPNWMKKMATLLPVRSLLEAIKGIQCLSSQNFREDLHWRFIFDQVMSFLKREPAGVLEEDWFQRSKRNLQACLIDKDVERIIKESDYTQSLLTWHIATELCIREEDGQSTSSGIGSTDDHKAICKLLSDYMFYLLILEPAMMAPVLNNWKNIFDDTYEDTLLILGGQSLASNAKNASRQILSVEFDKHKREELNGSVLPAARDLAIQLRQSYGYPWKRMSRVWVHLMGHAASNCRPNVHAQQQSKGGELLTFIWLCITNFGDRLLSNRMTKISLTDYL